MRRKMNYLLAYSGLTTKIRAMESRLISPTEFEQISNLTSVSEIINYLQNHPAYSDIFDNIEISQLHRGGLERLLMLSEYQSFAKLYNFSSVKGRRYLKLYFIKYETHLLKQFIREILDNKTVTIDIPSLSLYFDKFSDIDLKAISKATSLDDLINALKGTKYYHPLKRVQSLNDVTLFDYEICLDLFHFTTVWNRKEKYLAGKDLKIITEVYGTIIDLLNLQWIYRIKQYYNVSNADIYALIIPINYKLRKSQIREFIEADNTMVFGDMLHTTQYSAYVPSDSVLSLESLYKIVLNRMHKTLNQHNPYSLASVNNYLYRKHNEITKLIVLTECIRYSYTPAEIKKLIQ